jgi:hypothetical protein
MSKNRFGKYAIIDPITHNFEQEAEWWWKIKPPTSGDELAISKFLVNSRSEIGADGVRREFPPTTTEIAHREIALCFGGTNIPREETKVEEGGEPIAKVGAAVETIEAVLRQMPHPMVMEIWNAIGDGVVGWGPYRPKALTTTSE